MRENLFSIFLNYRYSYPLSPNIGRHQYRYIIKYETLMLSHIKDGRQFNKGNQGQIMTDFARLENNIKS